MPAPTTYEIGSTLVGIAELGSLTTPIPAPESTFNDYPDTLAGLDFQPLSGVMGI